MVGEGGECGDIGVEIDEGRAEGGRIADPGEGRDPSAAESVEILQAAGMIAERHWPMGCLGPDSGGLPAAGCGHGPPDLSASLGRHGR